MASGLVDIRSLLNQLESRFAPKVIETCDEMLARRQNEPNEIAVVIVAFVRRCFNLQKHLIRALAESDIHYLAWSARALLELDLFTEYISRSEANIKRFVQDIYADGNSAIRIASKNVSGLEEGLVKAASQKILEAVSPDLATNSEAAGMSQSDGYLKPCDLAKSLGREIEFRIANMALSKFAHTTAISVLLPLGPDEVTAPMREYFFLLGTKNALVIIDRLSKHSEMRGLPSMDA